ncbi:LysR substrate-binding domain-containing protein [Streptomyces sp. NPDC056488]|uniref:LysR substrate-binding domain-containing protein n=1 Tax=unclassified Streptomyces TaxID=2593676 RepID=UPI0036B61D3E
MPTTRRPRSKAEYSHHPERPNHHTGHARSGHLAKILLRALRVEALITEPRWVGIPTTHPLTELTEIPFRQLWDEPFAATATESGWWRDCWLATDERDGRPIKIGAIANNPDEWLTAIANGYGVSLTPEVTARFYRRPGVTYRPVTGVSPSQVGVAWASAGNNDAVIGDFIRACLRHRTSTTIEPDTRTPIGEAGAG